MHLALPVDAFLLGGALLLVAGVLTMSLAERFHAPALVLFLGLGMLIGDDGLAWIRLDDATLVQSVCVVALVVILFDGGLATPLVHLRGVAGPAIAMATVGTVITAGVVAVAARSFLDVSWTTALLLGAIVGPTDAAAVFAALKRVPLPRRLSTLLEAESGLNDPAAVLLTVGVLESWRAHVTVGELGLFAVRQIAGGLAAGVLVGWAASVFLNRLRSRGASTSPVAALGAAGLSYGLAVHLGASGFLAVYVCGLVLGRGTVRHGRAVRAFHQTLSSMAQIVLFLALGLLVFPSQLPSVAGKAVAVTLVLVVVARPIAVAASASWFGLPPRQLVLVSWSGLRGAVPIVLATFALTVRHPDGPLLFDVVFFVVLLSTLLQGTTIGLLARRLGIGADAPPAAIAPSGPPPADAERALSG